MPHHTQAPPPLPLTLPPQYPIIESLFEREAKRVVYVDSRVSVRAQEKKERDEEEAAHRQQVSCVSACMPSGTMAIHQTIPLDTRIP